MQLSCTVGIYLCNKKIEITFWQALLLLVLLPLCTLVCLSLHLTTSQAEL